MQIGDIARPRNGVDVLDDRIAQRRTRHLACEIGQLRCHVRPVQDVALLGREHGAEGLEQRRRLLFETAAGRGYRTFEHERFDVKVAARILDERFECGFRLAEFALHPKRRCVAILQFVEQSLRRVGIALQHIVEPLVACVGALVVADAGLGRGKQEGCLMPVARRSKSGAVPRDERYRFGRARAQQDARVQQEGFGLEPGIEAVGQNVLRVGKAGGPAGDLGRSEPLCGREAGSNVTSILVCRRGRRRL